MDEQLIIGLFSVAVSWATKRVVESISQKRATPLPIWLDEVLAGVAGVIFAAAAGAIEKRIRNGGHRRSTAHK
jgi:hypothetical protein